MQNLERHRAVVPEVFGQKHGGHAAAADLPLHAVAIGYARPLAIDSRTAET